MLDENYNISVLHVYFEKLQILKKKICLLLINKCIELDLFMYIYVVVKHQNLYLKGIL